MGYKFTALVIFVFFIINTPVSAQDSTHNSIEISPFYGLTMFSVKPHIMKGDFFGGEAVYHLSMANNKADWVDKLHVNDISFALSYRNVQNVYFTSDPATKDILGSSYGITSRLTIQLAKMGRSKLVFYPGFGFTWTTEHYYTDGNPLVGSHINFSAQLGLKFITPISSTTRLLAGVDIYHYSNAAVRLPNNGVNSLNASIGIDQDIEKRGPGTSQNLYKNYNKSSFEFGVNIGKRGLVESGGGLTGDALQEQRNAASHLYQSGFYLGYNYRLSPVFSLKAATDAVFYYTPFDYNNFYKTFQERGTSFNRLRVGAGLGFDIWLGRVAFELGGGHYIHYASYYPEPWYWTFGGKYYFKPWFAVEAKQYLHGTEANFCGFGFLFTVR